VFLQHRPHCKELPGPVLSVERRERGFRMVQKKFTRASWEAALRLAGELRRDLEHEGWQAVTETAE
jgi:hypothetical protein